MKFSNYKASRIFAKEHEEHMKVTVQKNFDVEGEVETTECTKSMDNKWDPPEFQYLTESEGSSSFDECGSDFGYDDDRLDNFDDLCGDFDGFGDTFRRKKVTAHWRSFIEPIMWRCKWAESQMKKLRCMAQRYDRELKAHERQKQIHLVDSTLIDGVKSLPFSRTNDKSDFLRRKRRRMIEETTDVEAYMSRHNLFPYYENENPTEEATMSDLPKGNTDDLSSFFAGDGYSSLENLFRKIELLQSRVCQLVDRVRAISEENLSWKIEILQWRVWQLMDRVRVISEKLYGRNWEGVDVRAHMASLLLSVADASVNVEEDGALIDNSRTLEW